MFRQLSPGRFGRERLGSRMSISNPGLDLAADARLLS